MKIFCDDGQRPTPSASLLEALRTIRPIPWSSYATLMRELEPYQLYDPEILEELQTTRPTVPHYSLVFAEPHFDRVERLVAAVERFRGKTEWALYRGTRVVVEGVAPRHWILAPKVYRDLDLGGTDPRKLSDTCLDREPDLFQRAEDDLPHLAAHVRTFGSTLPPPRAH